YDGTNVYSDEIKIQVDFTPKEFTIEQNYPNPFNPSTSIKYSVPYESSIKMFVFNTLGEIVKELVREVKATGNYEVNFNASHLSSGIYFYTLTAQPLNGGESFRSIKKLVLVK
ncbi:MAG: T9SS type A sorting domain-containing protein, partial [Ignavibacteria bacterium]|nr:T9SS type A sorting domain-containing protein [Ignavibacteria bacterium]